MKSIKRGWAILLAAVMLVLVAPQILPQTEVIAEAATVRLNKKKVTLYVGEKIRLKMKGTDAAVTWSTSNKAVATVNKRGKVTAKKAGEATISAKVNNLTYQCVVTVKKVDTAVEEEAEDKITCNLPETSAYYQYEYAYRSQDTSELNSAREVVFYQNLKACLDEAGQYASAYEQELAVHDYIILNCAYDTSYGANNERDAYYAEGVFIHQTAVCDGYAKAFKLCMDILGIPCIRVTGTGDGESHAWNAVQLDGEWYMVDVTWDDPLPDEPGRVNYEYFNITDEKMKRDHEYTCEIEATGTRYNYQSKQENYVQDMESYYAYLAEVAKTVEKGEVVTVIVEDGEAWTKERIEEYFDFTRVPGSMAVSVSYTTYVATFTWEFR